MTRGRLLHLRRHARSSRAALCILQRNRDRAPRCGSSSPCSRSPAIYVLLNAQFIAAIQVLVYAGAVMVLFLFVIMLLNLGHARSRTSGGRPRVAAAVVIVGPAAGRAGRALALHARPGSRARSRRRRPSATRRRCSPPGELARQETAARGVVGGVAAPLFQIYLVRSRSPRSCSSPPSSGAVVLAKRRI